MREIRSFGLVGLAGGLTVGAGLVHATAAGGHEGDATLVWLFAVTAVVQVVAGILLVSRPSRGAMAAATAVNLAAAAGWLVSRSTGIALVASLAEPEAVGLQDLTVTLMEVAAVLALAGSLRIGRRARVAALSPMWLLAVTPTFLGMTAPHTHGAGHLHETGAHAAGAHAAAAQPPDHPHAAGQAADHPHAAGQAADHPHTEGQPADHPHAAGLAADPVFAGADTSGVTDAQLRVAADLIRQTRQSVQSRFPTEASVVAAGYTSIGDRSLFSAFEHFVHAGYLADGRELDPDRVESIVVERTITGKRVASAMYVLEPGHTMADVPDRAGTLTTWHDHQNICWDDSGLRIAGFVRNGTCQPAGTFRVTPPMLHVWLQDHTCGPFAGIEGHGASSCTHAHAAG